MIFLWNKELSPLIQVINPYIESESEDQCFFSLSEISWTPDFSLNPQKRVGYSLDKQALHLMLSKREKQSLQKAQHCKIDNVAGSVTH
jgi:hypothetical protein